MLCSCSFEWLLGNYAGGSISPEEPFVYRMHRLSSYVPIELGSCKLAGGNTHVLPFSGTGIQACDESLSQGARIVRRDDAGPTRSNSRNITFRRDNSGQPD